jgi:hypothetical protein
LNNDAVLFDRTADAALSFELLCDLLEFGCFKVQTGNDANGFARSTFGLPLNANNTVTR